MPEDFLEVMTSEGECIKIFNALEKLILALYGFTQGDEEE